MNKNIIQIAIGFIGGMIIMTIIFWLIMPGLMLNVYKSNLNFEETVAAINSAAINQGWKVPKIYDIQKSLQSAGHEDMTRVKIISICNPHHAYNVLKFDENKKITAIMPCRVGIYEKKDGQVYLSEMNIGFVSKMFGGTIAEVMSQVADEQHDLIKEIIEN